MKDFDNFIETLNDLGLNNTKTEKYILVSKAVSNVEALALTLQDKLISNGGAVVYPKEALKAVAVWTIGKLDNIVKDFKRIIDFLDK